MLDAAADLQQRKEMAKDLTLKAYDSQVGYGRWVLASLVTIQGGSLVLILQAGKLASPLFAASGPALIVGLAATLVTGALAWVSFSVAAYFYARAWAALQNLEAYELSRPVVIVSRLLMLIAVTSATVSIVSFVYAAYRALAVVNASNL